MKRDKTLLEKRQKFVEDYLSNNNHRPMQEVVYELVERLFIGERTVWNIIYQIRQQKK